MCKPEVSGLPLSLPKMSTNSFCSSTVRSYPLKNTTPRSEMVIAKSRSKLSFFKMSLIWTSLPNCVPSKGVFSVLYCPYLSSRAPESLKGFCRFSGKTYEGPSVKVFAKGGGQTCGWLLLWERQSCQRLQT